MLKAECFGLLGVNGAGNAILRVQLVNDCVIKLGKTTTMSMITAQVMNNVHVKDDDFVFLRFYHQAGACILLGLVCRSTKSGSLPITG